MKINVVKLKYIIYLFAMLGKITYYLGRSWRKIPMRNETGTHKNDNVW